MNQPRRYARGGGRQPASASPASIPVMSICRRTGCILRGTKHEIASWLWGVTPATGILL